MFDFVSINIYNKICYLTVGQNYKEKFNVDMVLNIIQKAKVIAVKNLPTNVELVMSKPRLFNKETKLVLRNGIPFLQSKNKFLQILSFDEIKYNGNITSLLKGFNEISGLSLCISSQKNKGSGLSFIITANDSIQLEKSKKRLYELLLNNPIITGKIHVIKNREICKFPGKSILGLINQKLSFLDVEGILNLIKDTISKKQIYESAPTKVVSEQNTSNIFPWLGFQKYKSPLISKNKNLIEKNRLEELKTPERMSLSNENTFFIECFNILNSILKSKCFVEILETKIIINLKQISINVYCYTDNKELNNNIKNINLEQYNIIILENKTNIEKNLNLQIITMDILKNHSNVLFNLIFGNTYILSQ